MAIGNMTDRFIIVDAGAMRALLNDAKTQARRLAASTLRNCRPGDQIWVKEGFVAGRRPEGKSGDMSTSMRNAQFAVFADGWRQYRNGSRRKGPRPTNPELKWTPAIHMPRWASRATLVIESSRVERLQDISRSDVVAEGLQPLLAGLLWRWPSPIPGIWRDPMRAYAAVWNVANGTSGERWEDNPDVVVLSFRVKAWPPSSP